VQEHNITRTSRNKRSNLTKITRRYGRRVLGCWYALEMLGYCLEAPRGPFIASRGLGAIASSIWKLQTFLSVGAPDRVYVSPVRNLIGAFHSWRASDQSGAPLDRPVALASRWSSGCRWRRSGGTPDWLLFTVLRVNSSAGLHGPGPVHHWPVQCSPDQTKLGSFEPNFSKLF
jgi:hypothetical protein